MRPKSDNRITWRSTEEKKDFHSNLLAFISSLIYRISFEIRGERKRKEKQRLGARCSLESFRRVSDWIRFCPLRTISIEFEMQIQIINGAIYLISLCDSI